MTKKIYLSEPMTGYPEFNYPAFHAHATAIYLLPGWEKSRGATAEHALAICCGLEIVEIQ